MCLRPITLDSGAKIGCRKCWQCRSTRIEDLVGRCIAESVTAVATHVVTLTYGRDEDGNKMHNKAGKLEYRDVQQFLKRLRYHGYPVRYMITGEYGGEFGRAHWHGVLMWQEKVPHIEELDKRIHVYHTNPETGEMFDLWPHGFVQFGRTHYRRLRYALKYALKNEDNPKAENMLGFSRQPPLGTYHFNKLARKMARERLAPRDAFYNFSDLRRAGKLRRFMLQYASLDNYMSAYVEAYRHFWPGESFPPSPFLEEWLDKQEKAEFKKDTWGRKRNKAPVQGYVTKFQPEGGAAEWLEKPEGNDQLPIMGKPLPVREGQARPKETYAAWRKRAIVEERNAMLKLRSRGRLKI